MAKVNFKNLTKLKLALNFIRDKIKRTSSIKRGVEVQMPTSYGKFKLIPFLQIGTKKEHVVLFKGNLTDDSPLLVRMHSSCATGDIFSSMRCDCGEQLHKAMELIEKEGRGSNSLPQSRRKRYWINGKNESIQTSRRRF